MSFEKKDKYTIEDLLEIMKILRAPGGCPWDREQDHHSIRASFIEETYEAVEAIDTDNTELKEELGDVLLQVVFHSRIEEEAGRFNFDDVADGICKKMIVRHPHVFGDVTVENSADVLKNWDEIKKKTKSQKTQTEVLQSVSPGVRPSKPSFPTLRFCMHVRRPIFPGAAWMLPTRLQRSVRGCPAPSLQVKP